MRIYLCLVLIENIYPTDGRNMDRRAFLCAAVGTGALAGCAIISGGSTPDGYICSDGDPPAVPAQLACEDPAFDRHFTPATGPWGDADPLAMRIAELEYDYGETATITLANTSDEQYDIGNPREKISVAVYVAQDGDADWREVRGAGDYPIPYEDEAYNAPPGTVQKWDLKLTEVGISEAGIPMEVCPSLQTARYRFTFFGHSPPVSVAFDMYRE